MMIPRFRFKPADTEPADVQLAYWRTVAELSPPPWVPGVMLLVGFFLGVIACGGSFIGWLVSQ